MGDARDLSYVEDAAATLDYARTILLYEYARQRLQRTLPIVAPGAGNEWSATVPVGATWELLHVVNTFVTSAVVNNRRSSLRVRDQDGNLIGRTDAAAVQTASNTAVYSWEYNFGYTLSANVNQQSLPCANTPLLAGWTVSTQTALLDAGDAYSGIVLVVREWSTGQVFWLSDLLANELDFEVPTPLPTLTPSPVGTGQPIPVSPIAR